MGASERQPCESKVAPHGAAPESTICLLAVRKSSQVAGAEFGHACLRRQARMPSCSDHVEQERPAIHLAVNGVLGADRRDDIVEHILRDVGVPRLDDVGFDHRRHFHERRLADIDVPGTFAALCLRHEALDAEAFDRRNLVVDAGELGVHRRDAGVKVLDPLIERRRQRAVLRESGPDPCFRDRPDAGQAETRNQASREKLASVETPTLQLRAHRLLKDVLLLFSYAHRSPPLTLSHLVLWEDYPRKCAGPQRQTFRRRVRRNARLDALPTW